MLLNREQLISEFGSGLSILSSQTVVLRPASVVLHLGNRFRRWIDGSGVIRPMSNDDTGQFLSEIETSDRTIIKPGQFILGQTAESIGLGRNFAAEISPLSHLARYGLSFTEGASWINPGYGARHATPLTLEIRNSNPNSIELSAGMPVCHLRVWKLASRDLSNSSAARDYIFSDGQFYSGKDPLAGPGLWEDMGSADKEVDL
mgnify:CR=1 FL=1